MKIGSTARRILICLILVGSVTVVASHQQASAFGFVERQQIRDFQKLTGEFVVSVAKAIGDSNTNQGPQPHLSEFRKLTADFQRDMIRVEFRNVTGGKVLDKPDLLNTYSENVLKIFFGGPDTIPGLLNGYKTEVKRIFGLGPR